MSDKALILYKKLKYWPSGMLENIIHGLIRQEFDVKIVKDVGSLNPDLLIQWHHGPSSLDLIYKHGCPKTIMIEKGWFGRDNHFLLFDNNSKRLPPFKKVDYTIFSKPIKNISDKVWLILGQMPEDQNLKHCPLYSDWISSVTDFLNTNGSLPVYFRPHPELEPPKNTLDYDLGRAIGVVSWNSSAVLKALMNGIPAAVYDFPELDKLANAGLSKEWIMAVEKGKRFTNLDALSYFSSQQLDIADFSRYDYRGYIT